MSEGSFVVCSAESLRGWLAKRDERGPELQRKQMVEMSASVGGCESRRDQTPRRWLVLSDDMPLEGRLSSDAGQSGKPNLDAVPRLAGRTRG